MFSRGSPLKRKHSEFHDPDYHQNEPKTEEDDGNPCSSTDFKKRKAGGSTKRENETEKEIYLHKVRQVIEREFQREIEMKQEQLEEIDERLVKAKNLLDRLRYGIVLSYYKNQEIPITAADAASLRSSNCLFEREDKGPQMPLHPSLKKLIGKKPKDIMDVMRTCPKRTAAQNAVQTIRSKTQAQKREERKLKQIIRDQGIVIDHSKQNPTENDVNALLNAAAQNKLYGTCDSTETLVKQEKTANELRKKPSGKSLNASRLNNKIKHLIVVGNTSKYIGNEMEKDIKTQTKSLTYKWLVYVQSKDTEQPIERYIKKVRFHLHQSYRPNDVVDIESAPFQISRRGWGEFPIRVQLFFHSELHQKSVQLIHNIILDQTLSGLQTLGAETLLEIWLRDVKPLNTLHEDIEDTKPQDEIVKKPENPTNMKNNLMPRSEELVDDNLLDFLNKIESSPCSISADIEKIQPTVVVSGPLGVVKTPSPEKYKGFTQIGQKSPIKIKSCVEAPPKSPEKPLATLNLTNNSIVGVPQITTSESVIQCNSVSITSKPTTTFIKMSSNSPPVKFINNKNTAANINSQVPPLAPILPLPAHPITLNQVLPKAMQRPIILNKDGKIISASASVASAVRRTILPIGSNVPGTISTTTSQTSQISLANKSRLVSVPPSSAPMIFNTPKQILQKKLVQLVDSTGKVKYIQMLVAASTASSSSTQTLSTSSVAPKLITTAPSSVANSSVTNTTQITNTITTPLLKSPNGTLLMPAMTTKPNIFKIVPENIQTKPQILTFSTTSIGTANTNKVNFATANAQQKLQYSITTSAGSVEQMTQSLGQTKANSVANVNQLPAANSLQKSSADNPTIATKNLVFQKEGKLYIIDPEQMKYKQQQKKQVSLLKPQISLLKQQQQQQQQKLITQLAADINKTATTTQAPQVLFGSKQQRINNINALQLMQMKRMLFEKQFLRQEFTNIRTAVEFLLRRLKLVVAKDSLVSEFPFVSHTLQEFHSLTAFKQRACEWLRAKHISRLLRNHKHLQHLNNTSKEIFWTTKEIATFARQYAYTPPIKSLPKPGDEQQTGENSSKGFVDLVKSELKQEQNIQYDTLTDNYKVRKWVDKVWLSLADYEHDEDHHQVIDIVGIPEEDCKSNKRASNIANTSAMQSTNSFLDTYLAPPPHLENQCQLVSDICKDLNVKLAYEELDTKVHYPLTQTILAQCLHLFIEKVLRETIAFKQGKSSVSPAVIDSICTLMPRDFLKVLASNSEFDFLTNNNFGSASTANCLESSIKQERP